MRSHSEAPMPGQRVGFRVWGFGVLGFWGFGVLGFWGFGVLGFWGFGVLRFWGFAVLGFCGFGVWGFGVLGVRGLGFGPLVATLPNHPPTPGEATLARLLLVSTVLEDGSTAAAQEMWSKPHV